MDKEVKTLEVGEIVSLSREAKQNYAVEGGQAKISAYAYFRRHRSEEIEGIRADRVIWSSALLEGRTCPWCRSLDGQTFWVDDPFFRRILGQQHDG